MHDPVIYPVKQGASFAQAWRYEIDGVGQDLTGATIASQLRDIQGVLVATFNCTLDTQTGDTLGCFDIEMSGVVAWPPGVYYQDIRYTFANGRIEIVPDIGDDDIMVVVSAARTQ